MTFEERQTAKGTHVLIRLDENNARLARNLRFWRVYGMFVTLLLVYRYWSR